MNYYLNILKIILEELFLKVMLLLKIELSRQLELILI